MATIFHIEAWPIAISRFSGTKHSAEEVDEAYRTWVAQLQRGKWVLTIDLTEGSEQTFRSTEMRKHVAA